MGFLSTSELRDLRRDYAAGLPSTARVHRAATDQDAGGDETRELLPVGKAVRCRATPYKGEDVMVRGDQIAPEALYTVLCEFGADVRFADHLRIEGDTGEYEVLNLDGRGEAMFLAATCWKRG